jgi:hypothetical protein
MSKFQVRDFVAWTSQAGGFQKLKVGQIVAVVPVRTSAKSCLPNGFDSNSSCGYGMSRDHESYLVQVGNSCRLYWPQVKNLREATDRDFLVPDCSIEVCKAPKVRIVDGKEDGRYPYTYACDLIRNWAGYNESGTKLGRSDAAQIRSELAKVIGMDDRKLAEKLADYFLANQKALTDKSSKEMLAAFKVGIR